MTLNDSPTDTSRLREHTLATGVTVLDTEELQGIPKGSTIAVLGDPRSTAELLLTHLVHTDRPTHYVSTVRPSRHVRDSLAAVGTLNDDVFNIEDAFSASESKTSVLRKHAGRLEEDHNLIVDTISNLGGTNEDEYLQAIRNVYQSVSDNNALAYLYFAKNDLDHFTKEELEVLHMCDGIFQVTLEETGDNIDTKLRILKLRDTTPPREPIKLNVGTKLTVDTTRDIA